MPKLVISASDMSKGIPAEEGWYRGKLIAFEQKKNSKGDGYNLIPTIEYTANGVERKINSWFSNKSLGVSFAQFVCAIKNEKLEVGENLDVDTDDIKVGTELYIKVVRDVYNGRIINKIDNYLSIDEEVPF